MKDWILGIENCYGRFFDGCARAAQVCRIRRQVLAVEIADTVVVLNDQRSAV